MTKFARQKVDRLVRQVEAAEGRDKIPSCARRASSVEQAFVLRALKRDPKPEIHRSGWPDFLLEERGRTYGVEVKGPGDSLRPQQRATFAALERAGVPVYVWSPHVDDRLVPWSRWKPLPADLAKRVLKQHRQGRPMIVIAALEGISPEHAEFLAKDEAERRAAARDQARGWSSPRSYT